MSDEQLVMSCKRGERHAMEQLVEKYYLPLKAFFWKLTCNTAVSEDLTHNVLVKIIQSIEKYHVIFGVKFSTWLFKIAYNEYLNHVQRNPSVKEVGFDESIQLNTDYSDICETVENMLLRQTLRIKLKQLPEDMKTLITMRYYSGFSYQEIASITGMHYGKVKWKLHDALEKLKNTMKAVEGGKDA